MLSQSFLKYSDIAVNIYLYIHMTINKILMRYLLKYDFLRGGLLFLIYYFKNIFAEYS